MNGLEFLDFFFENNSHQAEVSDFLKNRLVYMLLFLDNPQSTQQKKSNLENHRHKTIGFIGFKKFLRRRKKEESLDGLRRDF